jgi:nitrogen fixation protein FixH
MSATASLAGKPRRSAWIPWVFVGAMLGVVAVNGVLITAAVTTFTGVTVGRSFDRGRTYNHVLAEAARQEALGWRAEIALADGGVLRIAVQDREGRPVPGALSGTLLRPLEGSELALELAEVAPGQWIAPLAASVRHGQWETRLTLAGPEGRRLDIRQRILVP